MPPKSYPKLPEQDGRDVRHARRGYVPLDQLKGAIDGTRDLFERTSIKTAYFCGLRASEVGLQPSRAFDVGRGTLDVARLKGSLPHVYLLEPWVLDDVRRWESRRPRGGPYLFPHPLDPRFPLDRHTFARVWARAAERAGLDPMLHHPHVLKHSIATHLLERGNDILFVQAWLGHKRLENTQVYAELTGQRLAAGQDVVRGLIGELV